MAKTQMMRYWKKQLTPQQQKAALLIATNEFREATPDGRKMTMQEIADAVGISRSRLYEWKRERPFIEYMNYVAQDIFESYKAEVMAQLMKSIRSNNPSVKAMELFFKLHGDLIDKKEIVKQDDAKLLDREELRERIEERKKRLKAIDGGRVTV